VTRTAIVTGAASGIGKELARQLATDGWHVVVADLNGDGAKRVAEHLPDAEGLQLDVTDADAVQAAVHDVHDRHGLHPSTTPASRRGLRETPPSSTSPTGAA